jgi:hypothetical protein
MKINMDMDKKKWGELGYGNEHGDSKLRMSDISRRFKSNIPT